jgi:hypothetical protein
MPKGFQGTHNRDLLQEPGRRESQITDAVKHSERHAPGRPCLGEDKKRRLVAYVKPATHDALYSVANLRGEEVGQYLDAVVGVLVCQLEALDIEAGARRRQQRARRP